MNNTTIYIQPLIGAITGGLAVWVAIQVGIKSILPKRRKQITAELSAFIADELGTDDIAEKLQDPQQLATLRPYIESHVDNFLLVKLKEKIPFIDTFIGESTFLKLKEGLMEEIDLLLPEVIGQYVGKMSAQMNPQQIISKKIEKISEEKFEILSNKLIRELKPLWLIGALTGLLIGIIQMLISLL